MRISEMEETIQNMPFVFEIMALQIVASNSACSDVFNMLTNSVKISDQTKADLPILNLPRNHEKRGY